MIRTFTVALTVAALATAASAQTQPQFETFQGQPQRYTLNYGSGELSKVDTLDAQRTNTAAATVDSYVNDCTNGSFVGVDADELIDWGVKAGGASTVVDGFVFGYATDALDPSVAGPGATLEVVFYEGNTGFGVLGTEVARFAFTGLPGSTTGGFTGFLLSVDISGGNEFCLPDGAIGYGFCSSDPGTTGPLLIDVTSCLNGTIDAFDVYACPADPSNYIGTFNLGGPPAPSASFYIEITEDDGLTAASTSLNSGTSLNPDFMTDFAVPPVLDDVWPMTVFDLQGRDFGVSSAFWYSDSLPGGLVTLTNGNGSFDVLVDPTSAFGLSQSVALVGGVADHSIAVPKNTSLVGLGFTVQAVQIGGGSPFSLSNALDVVVGF